MRPPEQPGFEEEMRWPHDSATAMSVAIIDWLLRDAGSGLGNTSVRSLLPTVLERLRSRRAILEAGRDGANRATAGDDQESLALEEFAVLSSRLILLAQTVPSLKAEVADELFSALLCFRELKHATAATCFLLGIIAGSNILADSQRQELVSFALSLLDAAGNLHPLDTPAEAAETEPATGAHNEASDDMLIYALTIIAEEIQVAESTSRESVSATCSVGSSPSSPEESPTPGHLSGQEETLAAKAFNVASSLLATALHQLSCTALDGGQLEKRVERHLSEGVLQAACRLSIVSANSRCGHQFEARLVQLLIHSVSTFGCTLRRQPVHHRQAILSSPAGSVESRDSAFASLSPQSQASPLPRQVLTSLSRRSCAGLEMLPCSMHASLPGASSLCNPSAMDGILSEAVEGLALFGCKDVDSYGASAASALVALCVEDHLLSMVPPGARARIRQQTVTAICDILRASSFYPPSEHVPSPPELSGRSDPLTSRSRASHRVRASGGHSSLVTDTVYSIADSLFDYSGGGGGRTYRGSRWMPESQQSQLRQTSQASSRLSSRDAVLLLGGIACHVGHTVTEHVQALMMEGLQSLPSALHELLLEQLVKIALLAPEAYYRTVADVMFARYSRPFDVGLDGPPEDALQLRRDLPACLLLLAENLACPDCLGDLSKRLLSLFAQLAISGQLRARAALPAKGVRRLPATTSAFKTDFVKQILAGILPALATAMERAANVAPAPAPAHDEDVAPGSSGPSPTKTPDLASGHGESPSSAVNSSHASSNIRPTPGPASGGGALPSLLPKGFGASAAAGAPSYARLIRNVWFYCALLGFVKDSGQGGQEAHDEREGREQWQLRWEQAAKHLARASPALLTPPSQNFLPTTLQLNDFAAIGVSDAEQSAIRLKLAESLNPKYRDIVMKERSSSSGRGLSFSQCAHFLAVLYLERLRVLDTVESWSPDELGDGPKPQCKRAGLEKLLEYAECSSADAPMVMEGIMAKVVDTYLEAAAAAGPGPARDFALEEQTCMLIEESASWVPMRRTVAQRALRLLLRRFAQLHWRPRCLFRMLRVYGKSVIAAKMTSELAMRSPASSSIAVNASLEHVSDAGVGREEAKRFSAPANGDSVQRHAALQSTEAIARSWLDQALSQAPLYTSTLLQAFLLGEGATYTGPGFDATGMLPPEWLDAGGTFSPQQDWEDGFHGDVDDASRSFAVNLIQEVIIGALSPGPVLDGRSGQKDGAGFKEKDGAGVVRARGHIMWRYWGGWAMHGGLDLSSLMRGLNVKGRFTGMARVVLGEREREREDRDRARLAEREAERLRQRERERAQKRTARETQKREQARLRAIEREKEEQLAQERAKPVKVTDKGRYWGLQQKREDDMASSERDDLAEHGCNGDATLDQEANDDMTSDSASGDERHECDREETQADADANGLGEMVERARNSRERLRASVHVVKSHGQKACGSSAGNGVHHPSPGVQSMPRSKPERSVANLASVIIEDMGVLAAVVLMLIDRQARIEALCRQDGNGAGPSTLGTGRAGRAGSDAGEKEPMRAQEASCGNAQGTHPYSKLVEVHRSEVRARAREFTDDSVIYLVESAFEVLRHFPAVGVRVLREANGLWAWLSVAGPSWLAAKVVELVCAHCERQVETGCGLFQPSRVLFESNLREDQVRLQQMEAEAHCTVQGLCAEFLQEAFRCYNGTIYGREMVEHMTDWLSIALARAWHVGKTCEGITPALQLIRLAIALAQEPTMAAAQASLLLDRALTAALWLLGDMPNWARGVGAAAEGIGTGVVRSRGSWVVVSSWVGSPAAGNGPSNDRARPRNEYGARVHLYIQLGVCVQLILKAARPHSVLARVNREWSQPTEEGEADMEPHRGGTISGTLSSVGGDLNRMLSSDLGELSRMTAMSADGEDVAALQENCTATVASMTSSKNHAGHGTAGSRSEVGGPGPGSYRENSKGMGSAVGSAVGGIVTGGAQGQEWAKMSLEERMRARAQLLLVILSSEVRRSSVWQNPRSISAESSLLERPFALEAAPLSSLNWSMQVQTAWQLAPRLALSLYKRYPHPAVLQEVKRCANLDPSALLLLSQCSSDGGEAASLAVTLLASLHKSAFQVPQHLPLLALCPPLPVRLALPVLMHALPSPAPLAEDATHTSYFTGTSPVASVREAVHEVAARPRAKIPPLVAAYVAKCVRHGGAGGRVDTEGVGACLFQLLQVALRQDASGQLEAALRHAAARDEWLFHTLVWLLRTEIADDSDLGVVAPAAVPPTVAGGAGGSWGLFATGTAKAAGAKMSAKDSEDRIFRQRCAAMLSEIVEHLSPPQRQSLAIQTTLVSGLFQTKISAQLTATKSAALRSKYVANALKAVTTSCSEQAAEQRVFVPTTGPDATILDVAANRCLLFTDPSTVLPTSSSNLTSNADLLLASFVVRRQGSHLKTFGGDDGGGPLSDGAERVAQVREDRDEMIGCLVASEDCRPDLLAVQLIQAIQHAVEQQGVELAFSPYQVLPVGKDRGLLQLPAAHANGRWLGSWAPDSDGENVGGTGSLLQFFEQVFGQEDSETFLRARTLMVQSLAASCLVTFLLQGRGRHVVSAAGGRGGSGGLILDVEGRLQPFALHSLFEPQASSDRNALRLTSDMMQLLGDSGGAGGGAGGVSSPLASEPFKYFCSLIIRGYLAVRSHHEPMLALVSLMLHSGLSCVKREALEQLRVRLQLERNEREAAQYMMEKIRQSAVEASHSSLPMFP